MTQDALPEHDTFLAGVRVLEVANELGEYCGKLLAGLGADVVKVEPPGGEETRRYGPFYEDDPDPNRSLYFWHFNFGKRGVTIDLDSPEGQASFLQLARGADVVVDTRPRNYLADRGVGYDALRGQNPGILYCRISPFGDDGPWADFEGSDLVHLALGGVAMNCGYDPEPSGHYDLPPIAPQMWQSYSIAGEMAAMGIVGALVHRLGSGQGQSLSVSVHDAVSKNTETDFPDWVYLKQTHYRRTCRHSMPIDTAPSLGSTKDGRYVLPYRTYLPGIVDTWAGTVDLLDSYGMAEDFTDEKYRDAKNRTPELGLRLSQKIDRLCGSLTFDRELWRQAQERGLAWAPLRRPEENVPDTHWQQRETFFEVEHPELGRSLTYVGAKWYAPEVPWRRGPRAPMLGEHNAEILGSSAGRPDRPAAAKAVVPHRDNLPAVSSPFGKPFALGDVRVVDLTWLLASAGAGRFLAAMGAEVIKVEHSSRWDAMRWAFARAPEGGRGERDAATSPLPNNMESKSPNRSGFFMDINAGKRGISLNLKHDRGRELLWRLIADADIVIEGFSPGTMERMGFGYAALKAANPSIIYVQQSGMGQYGTYGSFRSFGPTAQALAGLSDMSGLEDPYPPAGIGYSYLDWFGAYNMANAMLAALYRQRTTGRGCYIDSSQAEAGTYLTGTAVLDHSANGRHWKRYGNRSPYKPAAPHGVYRAKGTDRWVAIACFSDDQWSATAELLDKSVLSDPRFATLELRLSNQDDLDGAISEATAEWEPFELMDSLQAAGVPAGVCQNAEDRCERDPQLKHLGWLTEVPQSEIGTWPVKEFPVRLSETPSHIGGRVGRSGPSYGEDNQYVFGSILGLSDSEIEKLAAKGAI